MSHIDINMQRNAEISEKSDDMKISDEWRPFSGPKTSSRQSAPYSNTNSSNTSNPLTSVQKSLVVSQPSSSQYTSFQAGTQFSQSNFGSYAQYGNNQTQISQTAQLPVPFIGKSTVPIAQGQGAPVTSQARPLINHGIPPSKTSFPRYGSGNMNASNQVLNHVAAHTFGAPPLPSPVSSSMPRQYPSNNLRTPTEDVEVF